jgi:large subunit ribosomal protein L17
MRHRVDARKLGRTSAHRKAMFRNLVTSLLEHERIQTTDAKAKELRRIADRMITLGKRGSLHARRRALRVIRDREVAAKVFDDLAQRFRERAGGYTRIVKLARRVGDAAPMSVIELVEGSPGAATAKKGAAAPRRAATRKAPAKAAASDEKKAKKAASAAAKAAKAAKAPAKKAAAKPAKKAAAKPTKKAGGKSGAKASATRKTGGRKKGQDR